MSDMIKGDFMMNDMKELPQEIKNIYNNQPYVAKRLRDEREKLQKQSKKIGKRIGEKELRKGNHPWGVGSFKGVPDNIFAEEMNFREVFDNHEEDKIIDYLKKVKKHKNKIVSHLDSEGIDSMSASSIGEYDTDDSMIVDNDGNLTQEQLKLLRDVDVSRGYGKKSDNYKELSKAYEKKKEEEKKKRKNSSPQTKKKKKKKKGGRRTRRRRRKKRTRRKRKSRRKKRRKSRRKRKR